MSDFVWSDLLGIVAWLFGGVVVFIAVLGLCMGAVGALVRFPKIRIVVMTTFFGLAGACIAGLVATVYTFVTYGWQGGGRIFGYDRVAFILVLASAIGFTVTATVGFVIGRALKKL